MLKTNKIQFIPINEDTVQCWFFSTKHSSDKKLWEQLCHDINITVSTLSEEYIWHRDEFKVYLGNFEIKNSYFPPHLFSTTNFGDNVEDEWFIVYLILELTKNYEDLVIQIRDNDGDFLLIEAAEFLPLWVKPENIENRVFIHKNHLHIIPPNQVSPEKQLDLKEAIELVSNPDIKTQVPSDIEKAILTRIGSYPDKIKDNIHTAIVNLPLHIASLLKVNPKLIAPLVCTYYNHDVIDAKACKDLIYENCVNVEVKFTKFLYAMLMHAKPIKNIKHTIIAEKDRKTSIGSKLACGFHIIMKYSKNIYSSKKFHQYLKRLEENGYFKNNIEGSKQHQELLQKAKEFFTIEECPLNLHVSNVISKIMVSNEYAQQIENIKLKTQTLCEDDDDWLNIQPEKLNDLLQTKYGKKTMTQNEDETTQNLITKLNEFVEKTSDFEGIETYKDIVNEENETITFDPDEFSNCLEKFLNLLSSKVDDPISDLDTSDDEEDTKCLQDEELDRELQLKLNYDFKSHNCDTVSFNIIQSMKEEQASSGPSSNLLKAVDLNKMNFIDSDDDAD